MNRIIGLIGLASALCIAGCKTQRIHQKSSAIEQTKEQVLPPVAGAWELTHMRTETIKDQAVGDLFPEKLPFLIVDVKEGTVFGDDGCNMYRGTIQNIEESTLAIEPGVSSFKTPCEAVEDKAYKAAFWQIKRYKVDGDNLVLETEDHQIMLKYKRIPNRYE